MKGEAGERVLGRYRLEHPIGEGGFGQVFLGRQAALDREVAIKASRPGRQDDEGLRERFRREAMLVAGINHPNVVTYHDFGVDEDGDLVLVMELLKGCSLLDVLRRGRPVPLADVVRWMAQAASGLHEAHARGLVHRDVKPSNLFLVAPGTRAERLKVIDFGILLADPRAHPGLRDLTRSDAFIGTPEYVAPEMMLGKALDGRADQYALALVTYELISGRRPFPPADDGGMLLRLSERPAGLDFRETGRRVPPSLSAALWRALSPSPGERYPTITAFGDALKDAIAGFDEDGHDDRTRVEGDAATAPTCTMPTRPERGSGTCVDVEAADEADASIDRDAGKTRDLRKTGRGARTKRRGKPGAAGAVVAAVAVVVVAALAVLAWTGTRAVDGDSGGPLEASLAPQVVPDPVPPLPKPAARATTTEDAAATEPEAAFARPAAASPASILAAASPADLRNAATATSRAANATSRAANATPGAVTATPGAAPGRPTAGSRAAPSRSAVAGVASAALSVPPPTAPAATAAAAAVPAGAPAVLVLNAEPWADVEVDGRIVGRTPVLGVEVAPGTRRIVFRHPTLGTKTITKTVTAGARETVKACLQGACGGVSSGAASSPR